jgi:hypothetical protein
METTLSAQTEATVQETFDLWLDPHMMSYVPYYQVLGLKEPQSEEQKRLVGVCTGGSVHCRLPDMDGLVFPEPGEPGYSKELQAAARVLQNSWRTAKRYLLRHQSRATGLQDLDVGLAYTPRGPQLVFTVKHGSKTHLAMEKAHGHAKAPSAKGRGSASASAAASGKARLAVDKAGARSQPKRGQVH